MDAIPSDLSNATRAATDRLSGFASGVAVAPARVGSAPSQTSMAAAAREAIFADALLAAMHARLEEVKSVAK
jgi:hypothetical protein